MNANDNYSSPRKPCALTRGAGFTLHLTPCQNIFPFAPTLSFSSWPHCFFSIFRSRSLYAGLCEV